MCVVEKAGFESRTLGTEAERATNCTTAPDMLQVSTSRQKWAHGGGSGYDGGGGGDNGSCGLQLSDRR